MKDVYFTHLEVTEAFNIGKGCISYPILRKGKHFLLFCGEGLSHSPASEDFDSS